MANACLLYTSYKFLMTYADGSIQYWGTKNTTDSNPGAATPEAVSYTHLDVYKRQGFHDRRPSRG